MDFLTSVFYLKYDGFDHLMVHPIKLEVLICVKVNIKSDPAFVSTYVNALSYYVLQGCVLGNQSLKHMANEIG